MALYTDAAVITLEDLTPLEATVAQVAASHGISIENKISLAIGVVSDKLLAWLHNAGSSDPQWPTRRRLGLTTVVMTAALRRWVAFEALARVFAEAYNVQLNTRFQAKWTEYQQEAARASDLFVLEGLGIVSNPLPRPAMPLISVQSGTTPSQAILVQTSWTDTNGNESALSLPNQSVLPDQSSIVVAMAEGALSAPTAAIGWNVYAGSEAGRLTRQSATPLAIGLTWNLPATGLEIGAQPLDGQMPTLYVSLTKQIKRG